jgi:hypothetical protein
VFGCDRRIGIGHRLVAGLEFSPAPLRGAELDHKLFEEFCLGLLLLGQSPRFRDRAGFGHRREATVDYLGGARLESLNEKWGRLGRRAIHVGMGMNTAFVTYGNFGSHQFKDYTVIGSGVNLAARVEAITPGGLILLTDRTNHQVQDTAQTRLFAEVELKGISEPVPVYEVLAVHGLADRPGELEPSMWEWHDGDEKRGPFPKAGLEAMLKCGHIAADAAISKSEETSARSLAEVLGLENQ